MTHTLYAAIERMIRAGELSPGARGMLPEIALAQWQAANALDSIQAAREAARYGVRSVVIIEQYFYEDSIWDGQAEYHRTDDEFIPCETVEEAIDALEKRGLSFDATGAEWAADPDGSYDTNYATGERCQTSGHLFGWSDDDAAAIADAVG